MEHIIDLHMNMILSNYIHDLPVPGLKGEMVVETEKGFFAQMEELRYKLQLTVTDNQAARLLKEYLRSKDCKRQFVEPHNHRIQLDFL